MEFNNMKKLRNGKEVDLSPEEIEEYNQRELERPNKYKDLYKTQRQNEYPALDDMIVALWESVLEGNNVPRDDLQAERLVIKSKYPKPV